jgi:hypothetical protein
LFELSTISGKCQSSKNNRNQDQPNHKIQRSYAHGFSPFCQQQTEHQKSDAQVAAAERIWVVIFASFPGIFKEPIGYVIIRPSSAGFPLVENL